MRSFISSFEVISAAMPDPKVFFWITVSVPDGIKTRLANGVSTYFNKGKSVFSNGPKSQPTNIEAFYLEVFDNFVVADELLAKVLGGLKIWVLFNNNFWENLIPLLQPPIRFNERFNVTSVTFFVPDVNLLSCEL